MNKSLFKCIILKLVINLTMQNDKASLDTAAEQLESLTDINVGPIIPDQKYNYTLKEEIALFRDTHNIKLKVQNKMIGGVFFINSRFSDNKGWQAYCSTNLTSLPKSVIGYLPTGCVQISKNGCVELQWNHMSLPDADEYNLKKIMDEIWSVWLLLSKHQSSTVTDPTSYQCISVPSVGVVFN